ncbi:MAG: hypothetical protein BJ554DRAFT_6323 [Olpidium bornovanus]|uniref:Uncharacterized protein n=1 Tax=Olpidium bornovanus TaxID=278681 RepID=A0A8H7ZY16_9FUNG|nr:MAG: hypothetical protein BJ554DRAFT_6323 [Olpidium bornovanus]
MVKSYPNHPGVPNARQGCLPTGSTVTGTGTGARETGRAAASTVGATWSTGGPGDERAATTATRDMRNEATSSSLRQSKKRSHEHSGDVSDEEKGRNPDRARAERPVVDDDSRFEMNISHTPAHRQVSVDIDCRRVSEKFYDGIRSSQVDPKELTSYKWKFKNESEGRLEALRGIGTHDEFSPHGFCYR